MFGCASLPGTDVSEMALPLSYLHYFHPMPAALRVRARPELFVDMQRMAEKDVDAREGIRSLPPMLKGYVRAGCCIGDGAVIDRQFGTTDVFIYFPLSGLDPRYKSRFGLVK
jgi:putative hemolysin